MLNRAVSFGLLFFLFQFTWAQKPGYSDASAIHQSIEKLNFLGTALYVAAHPDDENTRLIAFLDNEIKARTTYLSLTRGDGGQNLIGPEIRELLGVIRTQELMMARSVDGGEQLFSRANDFGYSKHPDETLEIWEGDKVMADVVRAIRSFRPDIIINRFDANSAGETHGHHTASAMLSLEAFDLSNDVNAFPEQLTSMQPWQARRIFFNTSWWFYGSQEAFEKADKSEMVTVDVGVFYPWDGRSNTEIAAESRSMHKCQGFGSTGTRGEQKEYLQLLKGDMPADATNLFDGINTTWTRVEGGAAIGTILERVENQFDYSDPSASIPDLMNARALIQQLKDSYWRDFKLGEIDKIILDCAGAFIEARTSSHFVCPGQEIDLEIELTNRSSESIKLKRISYLPFSSDSSMNMALENNKENIIEKKLRVPSSLPYTGPYWLREPGSLGMYTVEQEDYIGLPSTPAALKVQFELEVAGQNMVIERTIVNKFNDPEDGAVYRPLEVIPPATIGIVEKVVLFKGNESKEIEVQVKTGMSGYSGNLRLVLPKSWSTEPTTIPVELENPEEVKTYTFKVTAPASAEDVNVSAELTIKDKSYTDELITIDYDHIPFQSVLMPAHSRFVRLDVKTTVDKVGYIVGAGDDIPSCLSQIGCTVSEVDIRSAELKDLQYFETIVMGVRAYNKIEELAYKHAVLMDYVKNGGTLVVQYNTNRGLKSPELGPFPLELSRGRVTMEDAPVRIKLPDHPVMNSPNKISSADFKGWVQERGLYFPGKWSDEYAAVLSSNDEGEEALDGGLLAAQYGDGWFVYTGYSWFRELPAGVPGAYRIFANLISLGHEE